MKVWLAWLFSIVTLVAADSTPSSAPATSPAPAPTTLPKTLPTLSPTLSAAGRKVFIIPVRDSVHNPLLYLIRRGVKQAIDQQAELLVLDMETPGGLVSTTREIIDVIAQFPGETVTYVN